MSERRQFGGWAIGTALFALGAILFSNLQTTNDLLQEAQRRGGMPGMLADLLLTPGFQVILILVALGLGIKAVWFSEPATQASPAELSKPAPPKPDPAMQPTKPDPVAQPRTLGALTVDLGFRYGFSLFKTTTTDDGKSRVVHPSKGKPDDPLKMSISVPIRFVNRGEKPASFKFRMSDRNTRRTLYPASEFEIKSVYGVYQLPHERFFYEPLRVNPYDDLSGTLWFVIDVKKEHSLTVEKTALADLILTMPIDIFVATDSISGETFTWDGAPGMHQRSALLAAEDMKMTFVRNPLVPPSLF